MSELDCVKYNIACSCLSLPVIRDGIRGVEASLNEQFQAERGTGGAKIGVLEISYYPPMDSKKTKRGYDNLLFVL